MTSPQQELAQTAHRILTESADGRLVSLSREELIGLGDDPLLAHAGDAAWWEQLSLPEQELVLDTVQRSLVARNLLTPDENGQIVASSEARLILAARTAPSSIVVLTDTVLRDSEDVGLQLVLLELPTEDGVVITSRVEGVYLHRLVRTDDAAGIAADWLLRSDQGTGEAGRTIQVLRSDGEQTSSDRRIVMGRGGQWAWCGVDDGGPGTAEPVDAPAIAAWLSQLTALV